MPKIDLLNCPFCGRRETLRMIYIPAEKRDFVYHVVCDAVIGGCGASTRWNYSTPEEAAEEWNNRASGWIPCSERLPNNAERCIVFMSDGNIQFGWWNAQYYDGGHDGGVWCVLYPGKPAKLFRIKNVPYWMPLPELPGGDKND